MFKNQIKLLLSLFAYSYKNSYILQQKHPLKKVICLKAYTGIKDDDKTMQVTGQINLENLDINVLPERFSTGLHGLQYIICQQTVRLTAGHIEPTASVTVPKVICVV